MIKNLFLCVGAQRSGSTWLYSHLKKHPDIGFAYTKEIHYFDTIHSGSILLARTKIDEIDRVIKENRYLLERYFADLSAGKPVNGQIHQLMSPVDDQWYAGIFSENKKKYAADFSPEYALLPDEGFEHINRICQNKKILFTMRDPIDRAKSAICYFFKGQGRSIRGVENSELVKLAQTDFIIGMSSYEATVQKLQQHFFAEDLLFLFFTTVHFKKRG